MTSHAPKVLKNTDFTGLTPKVAWGIGEIQIGAWSFLCLFVPKDYVECRRAQLIQVWPIYGVKMMSHAPKVLKNTDFTGFSCITPKVAWSIGEIQIGAWCFLCLFVPKGYVECRKAQLIQVWPIYGVKMTSHAPKVLKKTDFTGFKYKAHPNFGLRPGKKNTARPRMASPAARIWGVMVRFRRSVLDTRVMFSRSSVTKP